MLTTASQPKPRPALVTSVPVLSCHHRASPRLRACSPRDRLAPRENDLAQPVVFVMWRFFATCAALPERQSDGRAAQFQIPRQRAVVVQIGPSLTGDHHQRVRQRPVSAAQSEQQREGVAGGLAGCVGAIGHARPVPAICGKFAAKSRDLTKGTTRTSCNQPRGLTDAVNAAALAHEETPMPRGFACLGLDRPKTPENVGAVLRAASAYGVAQVNLAAARADWMKHGTNTTAGHRHVPTFIVEDPLAYVPHGTVVVAVDLVEDAEPLPTFQHPERALYVFGPEDGTLGRRILDRSHRRVMVPTRYCMNLAACVNVVLYDRLSKAAPFHSAYPRPEPQTRIVRAA